MVIQININELKLEQVIKLFSNPVSGIACDIRTTMEYIDHNNHIMDKLKNIRYSKSMIMKALEFWYDNISKYSKRIYKIYNPLINVNNQIRNHMGEIAEMYNMIKDECPDTFLFSHRHIEIKSKKYNNSMNTQLELLDKKYPYLKVNCKEYGFQESTLQPVFKLTMDVGIEFTVFPCEHPYISKQKINKVGITDNGNVYILHDREKNKK